MFLSPHVRPPGEHVVGLRSQFLESFRLSTGLPSWRSWLASQWDWLFQMCRTAEALIIRVRPGEVMCRETLEHAQGIVSLLTDVSCLHQWCSHAIRKKDLCIDFQSPLELKPSLTPESALPLSWPIWVLPKIEPQLSWALSYCAFALYGSCVRTETQVLGWSGEKWWCWSTQDRISAFFTHWHCLLWVRTTCLLLTFMWLATAV